MILRFIQGKDVWITNSQTKNIEYQTPISKVNDGDGKKETTCGSAIPGVGWIMCQVLDLMAKVVDGSYSVVSSLLTTPSVNMGNGSDTYKPGLRCDRLLTWRS